jgi:hypothetical protein
METFTEAGTTGPIDAARRQRWEALLAMKDHSGYVDLLGTTVERQVAFDQLAEEGPQSDTKFFKGSYAAA